MANNQNSKNPLQYWTYQGTRLIVFLICVTLSLVVGAHVSFAAETNTVLGPSKAGWLQATPGYEFVFPRDHGSHDEYGLEWWYFTGHLSSQSGRRFGYELTFFRKGVRQAHLHDRSSEWAIHHLYFAHLALTDLQAQTFHFAEKLSRAGLGKAGANAHQMEVWIDKWSLKPVTPDHQSLFLKASKGNIGLNLTLNLRKSPVVHGEDGISRKGTKEGQASHYYSLTRLATQGEVVVDSTPIEVTGLSWMDHEFGSGELGQDQVGWDWFSLQFDSDMELMVYRLRKKDGSPDPASSGTLIVGAGNLKHLQVEDIVVETRNYWMSPHSHTRYPSEWVLEVPSAQLRVQVIPVLSDQELRTSKSTRVTYWEGAVDVEGQYRGRPIRGQGYVELTGYSQALRMDN